MIGTKLSHYEITSHLGTGGMGEVYQATDGRLGRSVAIKLLPEAFTHDRDSAVRFEREARVLASLNHPNIAVIHGIDESAGRRFLIMELVGGETLAERIQRGPVPIDEAIRIAKQIAEGLESAHQKGIIHRDLKPANIKITTQGQVKLLDFGLAKAFARDATEFDPSNSPTIGLAETNAGMIMGTAGYMSPEQAQGKTVDERSDIFSFGAVLYELLSGRRPFTGTSTIEVLSAVMRDDPTPMSAPEPVMAIVRRCLAKRAVERFASAAELRAALYRVPMKPVAQEKPSIHKPSLPAYEAYLRYRYYQWGFTPESLKRARECLEQALALDPQFALPYVGLADIHIASASVGGMASREAMPQARTSAKRALELDPDLPEAHAAGHCGRPL